MKYISLFLYSAAAFSICQTNIELPLTDFIDEMNPIIEKPWAAATELQVETYKCQSSVPSYSQMESFLNKSTTLSKSLDYLLNKEGSLTRAEIKTDLSLFNADQCQDEICKAKKVFGDKEGLELLYMIEKYGLNASHLVHKDTKAWTSKALKPYLNGLQAVPEFMLPISKNQQFTKSSTDSKNIADASITFYGGIDEFTDTRVSYTTFHEIAHYVAGSIHVEDDEKWMSASGWEEDFANRPVSFSTPNSTFSSVQPLTTPSFSTSSISLSGNNSTSSSYLLGSTSFSSNSSPLTSALTTFEIDTDEVTQSLDKITKLLNGMKNDDQDSFISRYAQTNPLEDIAESITAYRFNPEKLKETSPSRYEYIKDKVFLGVEYLKDSSCETATNKRQQFMNLIKP